MLGEAATVKTQVRVETLDTLVAEAGIAEVDLVKIDVERHEADVLSGMAGLLQSRPAIVIEILDAGLGESVGRLVAPHGYRWFAIREGRGLEEVSALGRHERNYLLCTSAAVARLYAAGLAISENPIV